jgi:hypothetical protein
MLQKQQAGLKPGATPRPPDSEIVGHPKNVAGQEAERTKWLPGFVGMLP